MSPSKKKYFFFSSSSIDQYSEEGGTSDVAGKLLGCVRVQLSQGRRKQGIKRERGPELDALVSPRQDPRRAHPRTDTQTHKTWRAPRRKTTKRNYYGTSNER